VAVIGLVATALGAWHAPDRALLAYLVAFAFVASIPLGALFVLLIGYAASARWLSVVRRVSAGLAAAMLPVPLLFVPIALGLSRLYPWARPRAGLPERAAALLAHKAPYLNVPFFIVRAFVYFAIWLGAAFLLRHWGRRAEQAQAEARESSGDAHEAERGPQPADPLARERAFSSFALVPVSLATTFAAFDWLMSLRPSWFSTMYGVYYFAGSFLVGWAVITLVSRANQDRELAGALTPHHFHALGRMLFAFVIFWAYTAYFQIFLMQIANRASEVDFLVPRLHGVWRSLTYVLALGHFALPFFALLPRSVKFRPNYVAAVALWLVPMHYLDVYWLVLPSVYPDRLAWHWLDAAALAALGGVGWTAYVLLERDTPLLASGDPFLAEGIDYVSPT
jgi:hypothetical protein